MEEEHKIKKKGRGGNQYPQDPTLVRMRQIFGKYNATKRRLELHKQKIIMLENMIISLKEEYEDLKGKIILDK